MIIAKYKFDKSIYSNLIPIFNDGYNGYTITDEIDSENSNHVIRTIECDVLPTLMRFGSSNGTSFKPQRDSLLELIYLNTINIVDMTDIFAQCSNLISVNTEGWNTSNVTSMYTMFYGCTNLTSLDVSKWDTSNVTTMRDMFHYCSSITEIKGLENWDTSKVTTMRNMFARCGALLTADVSNFNTSKVTDIAAMFSYCGRLKTIDVSKWDTSNVTNMTQLVHGCQSITTLDVSNFDTSKVIDMNAMFWGCYNLTSLDLSNFDTSKVTDIGKFINTYAKEINLNNIKFTEDKLNGFEFCGITRLEKLYVNDLDLLNLIVGYLPYRTNDIAGRTTGKLVTSIRNKISVETLTDLTTKNWEIVDIVAQYRYDANTYEDLIPEFNTEFSSDKYEIHDSVSEIVIDNIKWEEGSIDSITGDNYNSPAGIRLRSVQYLRVIPNIQYNFSYDTNIRWYDENKKIISEASKHTNTMVSPSNAKYLRIYQGEGTTDLTISAKLVTRSIESVNGNLPTLMRFGSGVTVNGNTTNKELALLKVFDINTNELITAKCMFQRCERLSEITNIHIGNKVTDTSFMFENCILLKTIDVSNWDTSNVIDMQFMFNAVNTMAMTLTSLNVSNWDTGNVTNMACIFGDCEFLTTLDLSNFNTSKVTDMGNMFQNCSNLTSITFGSNFDTSNVTSMSGMFYDCFNLTTLDVSNFDTSKVGSMYCMFYDCFNLTTLDVSNFDTSNVTTMQYMFYQCKNLITLDVSNFNTSNVTDMSLMFNECKNLTSLDVGNWDTSKVTSMNRMFCDCYNLTSLDVSNFNTSNVTNMQSMFYNCSNLTSLDVSNWDTSNVTNIQSMFYYCKSLTSLDVSNWNTSNVKNMYDMFVSTSLTRLDIGNWNTSKVISVAHMLYNCKSLMVLDINNFNISNLSIDNIILETSSLRYIRCNNIYTINTLTSLLPSKTLEQGILISDVELSEEILTTLSSKNWTVVSDSTLTKVAEYVYDSNTWNSMIPTFNDEFVEYFIDDIEYENGLVTRTISSMGGLPTQMIFGTSSITNKSLSLLKILNINSDELTSMRSMFYNCQNVTYINSNFNTSKMTDLWNVFQNCSSLTYLDLSNWDTSKVNDINYIFSKCSSLTYLDLSNWDTSKLNTMYYSFHSCNNLQEIKGLNNWNTDNVTNMGWTFSGCSSLTKLDVSNWNTSNVTDISWIFANTPLLTDIGMLYCTPSTINTIASNLPTIHTQTIWVQDADINKLTSVSGVEFKEYKENSYMINLSSPLLNGDRIEVVDGKLCHYHKMGKVVFDGSEDWKKSGALGTTTCRFYTYINNIKLLENNWRIGVIKYSDKFRTDVSCETSYANNIEAISSTKDSDICINIKSITSTTVFKQWLSKNPTTVVYELAEPYYEDITPLQSDIVLETYLECNLDIYTNLPIKTNLTYLTNIANTSSIEEEINAINEGTDLTNLLEDEINN